MSSQKVKKVIMGEQKLVGENIINLLILVINPKDDSVYECLMWTKNSRQWDSFTEEIVSA